MLSTSVNNQRLYCIWERYHVSRQYWLHHIFFIVCSHRHGMMELQLMSRNEFLLCLIKTKQSSSSYWQHEHMEHHAHVRTALWPPRPPAGSRVAWAARPTGRLEGCRPPPLDKRVKSTCKAFRMSGGDARNPKAPHRSRVVMSTAAWALQAAQLGWVGKGQICMKSPCFYDLKNLVIYITF